MGNAQSLPVPVGQSCLGSALGQLGSIQYKTSLASGLDNNVLIGRAKLSLAGELHHVPCWGYNKQQSHQYIVAAAVKYYSARHDVLPQFTY